MTVVGDTEWVATGARMVRSGFISSTIRGAKVRCGLAKNPNSVVSFVVCDVFFLWGDIFCAAWLSSMESCMGTIVPQALQSLKMVIARQCKLGHHPARYEQCSSGYDQTLIGWRFPRQYIHEMCRVTMISCVSTVKSILTQNNMLTDNSWTKARPETVK